MQALPVLRATMVSIVMLQEKLQHTDMHVNWGIHLLVIHVHTLCMCQLLVKLAWHRRSRAMAVTWLALPVLACFAIVWLGGLVACFATVKLGGFSCV
jgi:hypothetical protein